jgi:hypothetical protein
MPETSSTVSLTGQTTLIIEKIFIKCIKINNSAWGHAEV